MARHIACRLVLGGPLGHVMVAKALAFAEAGGQPSRHARAVADNAVVLAEG